MDQGVSCAPRELAQVHTEGQAMSDFCLLSLLFLGLIALTLREVDWTERK
jgi:hypothetical protein